METRRWKSTRILHTIVFADGFDKDFRVFHIQVKRVLEGMNNNDCMNCVVFLGSIGQS